MGSIVSLISYIPGATRHPAGRKHHEFRQFARIDLIPHSQIHPAQTRTFEEAKEWIEAILNHKEMLMYNEVVCREMACLLWVAKYEKKIMRFYELLGEHHKRYRL